jgi:hypothetical protein
MLSLLGTSYITNEALSYTLLTIHNYYDMTKFLCIYQSPYCLSVDNDEGIIQTTSQVVFVFIVNAMCQNQFYNL